MPQHLKVIVAETLVAALTTSNKGPGTLYDVLWCSPEVDASTLFPNEDTREPTQPQDSAERREDFNNDFAHARRCIAAVVKTAKRFLDKVEERGPSGSADRKPILMLLTTNARPRGWIEVHPADNEQFDVEVQIGRGGWQRTWRGMDAAGKTQAARALKVLDRIGPELLEALPKPAR